MAYSSYNELIQTFSPVYYFPLDGSWPLENKGSVTLSNLTRGLGKYTFTELSAGRVGKCLLAPSSSQGPYALSSESTSVFTTAYTISFWVKFSGNDGGGKIFNIYDGTTNRYSCDLSRVSGSTEITLGGQSKTLSTISNNTWTHIAISVDSSGVATYYLNGTAETGTKTISFLSSSYNGSKKSWLANGDGTVNDKNGGFALASIDEIAIFPSALSSTNINDLYDWPRQAYPFAEPMTASSLAVEPDYMGNVNCDAEVMTASSLSGDHVAQNLTLEEYMKLLSLEQYYRFTPYKGHDALGSGGDASISYSPTTENYLSGGIQLNPYLQHTGSSSNGIIVLSSVATSTELSDGNFVLGFWYKSASGNTNLNLLSALNPSAQGILVETDASGKIFYQVTTTTNSANILNSSKTVNDDQWHFIVCKLNSSVMELWIDNEYQNTRTLASGSYPSDAVTLTFASANRGSKTVKQNISQFFIGTTANVTEAILTKIYTYGSQTVNARAELVDPIVKLSTAYNDKVETLNPTFDFRINEGAGSKVISDCKSFLKLNSFNTNYSLNNDSKNFKGIKFTNRNTYFHNWYSTPSGTFSTNNKQTLAVLVKTNSITGNTNNFATTGGGTGDAGIGLFLGTLSGGTAATARINGGGAGTDVLTGTTTITDGNWHLLVAVKDGTSFKLYVDGKLDASMTSTGKTLTDSGHMTIGAPPFSPGTSVGALARNTTIDEVQVFPTALSAQEIFELWQAITIDAGMSASSLMVQPTVSFVTPVTVNADVTTASAEAVYPASFELGVNLDAFGVATASATDVMPTFDVTANIDYAAGTLTASAEMTAATVDTQVYVDYNAAPATASALLSANVYYGDTRQDTSYSLTLRSINDTTNASGNNGFDIGANWSGGSVTNRHVLAIKPNSGFPIATETVKAKFDSTHVTASSSNDVSPLNTFDVYVFTANPGTTFDTMTYGNMPAKEFIFTTRLVDDGSNTQFYLDLTPAFADSRSHTYGVLIEPNTSNTISGTQYDRTTFTGTNLQNHLIYVLTTDHVDKNVNADPSTASGLFEMPAVDTQRYVNIQDGVATATGELVDPDIATSDSVTINDNVSLVTALLVNPAINISANYTSDHLEAFAQGAGFIVSTTSNANVAANAMTASGVFHMPQFDIGENNSADHMDASAMFPMPLVVIPDTNTADIMTASATSPNATITTELKGRVFAEPMLASAFHVEQLSFYNFLADNWYARLNLFHNNQSGAFAKPFIKWMRQSTNLGVGSTFTADRGYAGVGTPVSASTFTAYTPWLNVETPALEVGYFDDQNRKAVRFKNIAYSVNTGGNVAGQPGTNNGAFSFEMMFKTTKQNQELMYDAQATSQYASGNTVTRIGLYGGKFYAMQAQVSSNYNDVVPWNTTYGKGTEYYREGFKNVADGQWHHVVIQYGLNPGRFQIWIDGKLDVQRYDISPRWPTVIGGNSFDARGTADFYMSAMSFLPNVLLSEKDITLNYSAALGYNVVEAAPMIATAEMTQNTNGRGNRPRALVLYWWPKQQGIVESRASDFYDDIQGIEFDYPTFFQTLDTYNPRSQKFYDWDAYTVDVTGEYASEVVKSEAYSGGTRTFQETIGLGPGLRTVTKSARGFRDTVTDNRRYLDIFNDVDLDQVEAIFFFNYPDQSREIDAFSRDESVDEYFRINEKQIYEQFLVGLRKAIDTGINVMISNPQLAIDLGIVDRVETVDPLIDGLSFGPSGGTNMPESFTSLTDYNNDKDRALALVPLSELKQNTNSGRWIDLAFNNRLRIVNTLNGVTNLIPFVKTDEANYINNGLVNFAGNDEYYSKVNYYSNGLSVGNEMLITDPAGQPNVKPRYQAVPFENVKAGKVIAAFGQTYKRKNETLANPYANYATHIALERGTVLNGKPLGGRIWVTLTERPQFSTNGYNEVELTTDYWINLAHELELITSAQRTTYLNSFTNLDRQLAANQITQAEYNKRTYWSFLGYNQTSTVSASLASAVGQAVQALGQAFQSIFSGKQQSSAERAGLRSFFNYNPSNVVAQVSTYRSEPTTIFPSITLNGAAFGWLANKESQVGVIREPSAIAQATMVNPTVVGDKVVAINVQAMVSSATAVDPTNIIWTQKSNNYVSLPMTATALMTPKLTLISAAPMTASAVFKENIVALVTQVDEVILYLNHVDPILYLREDVVK